MMRSFVAAALVAATGFATAPVLSADRLELEQHDQGVTVKIGDQLFTRYLVQSGNKPILWPILGPSGKEMTRGYPMRPPGPAEKKDHEHHRSLWFDHGSVNGVSFWHENQGAGTIVHREFLAVDGGPPAVIRTRNDWIAPDGTCLCTDTRTLTFGANDQCRWIDFDVTVTAVANPVVFGDTKEGSFGVRVAGTMRAERDQGGTIVNSEGLTDKAAWGQRAAWVDYSGPVAGERVGIAILNHPRSFRFPTFWHVRTYGLFAANPFGWHDFLGSDEHDGSLSLRPGEAFSLFYRVILHRGDHKEAGIAAAFADYARVPKAGPQPEAK